MIVETYPVSNISPLWLYFGLSLMFTVLLTRLPSTISWEKVSIPYLQKEQQTVLRQNYYWINANETVIIILIIIIIINSKEITVPKMWSICILPPKMMPVGFLCGGSLSPHWRKSTCFSIYWLVKWAGNGTSNIGKYLAVDVLVCKLVGGLHFHFLLIFINSVYT